MDQLCGWKILYCRWYILKSWWSFYYVFAEIFNIFKEVLMVFISFEISALTILFVTIYCLVNTSSAI